MVLRQFRTLYEVGTSRGLTDGQLLERFATAPGEPAGLAFSLLVERHGPMVLRVCRGLLADPHDAHDAFQATFLVLMRRAPTLWVRDSLGPWLHEVACRTALRARAAAARRREVERSAAVPVGATTSDGRTGVDDELRMVLHEELGRLPERYRVPVVLCDLGDSTHEQAARHLGWPVGTVKSRLARGRERLRDRLRRRGVSPEAGILALALRPPGPELMISSALLDATARAATCRLVAGGAASNLAREVLVAMSMTRWLKVAAVLLSALATVSGARLLAQGEGAPPTQRAGGAASVVVVKPGPLRVVVSDRGRVEVAHSEDIYSLVEGQTTVLRLLPEGTKVTKGQIVCELDSASLKDQLTNQTIATRAAEAAYHNARLGREVAEIAVTEYLEGVYKQELESVKGEAALARASLEHDRVQLERARRVREQVKALVEAKGHERTVAEILAQLQLDERLEAAELSAQRDTLASQTAETRAKILQEYTRPRTIKQLKSDVETKRAGELQKQSTWELETSKEAKLNRQIERCVIKAPAEGMLVYANDPRRAGGQPAIEEGATVRERQKLFSIPNLDAFNVIVNVREAVVDRVTAKQPVRVKVDAFPGQILTGVVTQVAPLPDSASFTRSGFKMYPTVVKLDTFPAGLRPGMTAGAEILVSERQDVLSVPQRSVLEFDDRPHVAVRTPEGRIDWRAVTLGMSDDTVVEVKEGLHPGESVVLNPRSVLSHDEKRSRGLVSPEAAPPAGPDARPIDPRPAGKTPRR